MPKSVDNPVLFRCTTCNCEEFISKDVVDFFDSIDDGDLAFPPRFDCQSCSGKMQPVYYISQHGTVYKL